MKTTTMKETDKKVLGSEVAKILQEQMPDCVVDCTTIHKTNCKRVAITIRKADENVSPTIYLESFLNESTDATVIAEEIKKLYLSWNTEEVPVYDVQNLLSYENIKDKLIIKLLNYEKNEEFLQTVPHSRFQDLAVIFCILVSEESGSTATSTITNSLFDGYDVTKEVLEADAFQNSSNLLPMSLNNMSSVLDELTDMFEVEPLEPGELDLDGTMFVLSNENRIYGAASMAIPGNLKTCGEMLGGDFFIIPSSIHEVLLIPVSTAPVEDAQAAAILREMVQDVNDTQVEEDEILSYNVYRYSVETNTLSIA